MSAPKRQKMDDSHVPEAQGYVHNVSPIKISRNNNRYFNACFQESDKYTDLVCFAPDLNSRLADLEKTKSPVNLTNITKMINTRKPGTYDIKVTSAARICVPARKLQFRFEEPESQRLVSIEDVKLLNPYQKVTVEGKVLLIGENSTQTMKSGTTLKKAYISIADATSSIQICVWGRSIDLIEMAQSYRFVNVSVRNFDSVKSLTTSPDSMVEKVEDIGPVKTEDPELISVTEMISINSVSATECTLCSACNKDVGIYNSDTATVKCTHCLMRQKTSALVKCFKAVIMCKMGQSETPNKLTIPNSVLQNSDLTKFLSTPDEIEDFFLSKDYFVVELTPSKTQILSIKDAD